MHARTHGALRAPDRHGPVPLTRQCDRGGGDGLPDTGEQCDAGVLNNTLDSCCSATCTFTNAGTPCTDTVPGDYWNFVD